MDAQWEEAERLFEEHLNEYNVRTLTQEKCNEILDLLYNWDKMEAKERKESTQGNAYYWRKKYDYVTGGEGEDALVLVFKDTQQRVCTRERLFNTIKDIHVQSALPHVSSLRDLRLTD